ncbi:MAG: lytic murein transglycosylase B [Burkholderiaceae bacterium]|jgi:membrane-bound lytic murein transglycosylase B|nr:lytic murein transglycosylase B [Burkholderiaceae bacterium]
MIFSGLFFLAARALADAAAIPPVLPPCSFPEATESTAQDYDEAFEEHLAEFADEMAERHGFDKESLACLFGQVRRNEDVIRLITPLPTGTQKNWRSYRARFIETRRLKAGARFWNQHRKTLAKAEKTYGVPPEIIVGIIGVETIYGKNKGNFRTIDALATLAFDYPEHPKREARMALFRNELENVLLFSAEQGIDPISLRGSYAGAIGLPQFLPSSIRKYAVDFDGDGNIDLRYSPADAIGSIANFLVWHGWTKGAPIVFPATLDETCPRPPDDALNPGLTATLTPDDLREFCVTTKKTLPGNLRFGLVDMENGNDPTSYWLATDNFFAITHYNRSYFYAMTVIDLGNAVKAFRKRQKPARTRRHK